MTLHIDRPSPGTYRMKRTKGGIWVPVLIWRPCVCTIGGELHDWTEDCDRFPQLRALVDGWEDMDPQPIWTWCHPIEQAEYEFLVADHGWARSHAQDLPEANPRQAVNLNTMKPLF